MGALREPAAYTATFSLPKGGQPASCHDMAHAQVFSHRLMSEEDKYAVDTTVQETLHLPRKG